LLGPIALLTLLARNIPVTSFTISEETADRHELMIPQHTMRLSLPASANNWTRSLQLADIPPPPSATLGLRPVARFSHSAEVTKTVRNCRKQIRMCVLV